MSVRGVARQGRDERLAADGHAGVRLGVAARHVVLEADDLDPDARLQGYISRQRVYTMYRKMVADMSED